MKASSPPDVRVPMTSFVSYAHEDADQAQLLLDELGAQLAPSQRYRYQLWRDATHILAGEDWDARIRKALEECDWGLLLLSPRFLASPYIRDVELPRYVTGARPCIPALLLPVDLVRHQMHGLGRLQIFALQAGKKARMRSFGECVPRDRRRFAQELFVAIERRLDTLGAGVTP